MTEQGHQSQAAGIKYHSGFALLVSREPTQPGFIPVAEGCSVNQ